MRYQLRRFAFYILCLHLVTVNAFIEASQVKSEIKNKLKLISIEDRSRLNDFFSLIFKELDGGYTLLGDEKAISFDRFYYGISWNDLIGCHDQLFVLLNPLWDIWEKYQTFFPSKNFILKKVMYLDGSKNVVEYLFINLKVFEKIFSKNRSVFQEVFGKQMEKDHLLNVILERGLFSLNNHRIIGILLGYGNFNASLFEKRSLCLNSIVQDFFPLNSLPQEYHTLNEMDYLQMRVVADEGKRSIQINRNSNLKNSIVSYKELDNKLGSSFSNLSKKNPLSLFSLPCFKVDRTNRETHIYLQKYLQTKQLISNFYQQPDFLENFLIDFCE